MIHSCTGGARRVPGSSLLYKRYRYLAESGNYSFDELKGLLHNDILDTVYGAPPTKINDVIMGITETLYEDLMNKLQESETPTIHQKNMQSLILLQN